MKMKKFLLVLLFPALAQAGCFGSDTYKTCTDDSGNTYQVNKFGNQTVVNGRSQDGNAWNQTSNKIGNQTITNGNAANGQSWNSTTTSYGNGQYNVQGTDANGQSFYKACNQYGCN